MGHHDFLVPSSSGYFCFPRPGRLIMFVTRQGQGPSHRKDGRPRNCIRGRSWPRRCWHRGQWFEPWQLQWRGARNLPKFGNKKPGGPVLQDWLRGDQAGPKNLPAIAGCFRQVFMSVLYSKSLGMFDVWRNECLRPKRPLPAWSLFVL